MGELLGAAAWAGKIYSGGFEGAVIPSHPLSQRQAGN